MINEIRELFISHFEKTNSCISFLDTEEQSFLRESIQNDHVKIEIRYYFGDSFIGITALTLDDTQVNEFLTFLKELKKLCKSNYIYSEICDDFGYCHIILEQHNK